MPKAREPNRYSAIIEGIFFAHWKKDIRRFPFVREEIKAWSKKLKVEVPDNLGDLIYTFRFRNPLPQKILDTQTRTDVWRIELAGRGRYEFVLGRDPRVLPRTGLVEIKIPDATPELIGSYTLDDEQALLAIVRYNRLIDVFLG